MSNDNNASEGLITLTADIVAAHVSNNNLDVTELPALIRSVHDALASAGVAKPAAQPRKDPAVPIRSSVKPDYVICLEDGKKLKMLKRHLMTHYQMTPADYRTKWNLPADYPMVAPNYAEQRRTLAKSIGLGRKPRTASAPAKVTKGAPARRGRPKGGEDQPPK